MDWAPSWMLFTSADMRKGNFTLSVGLEDGEKDGR